MKKLIYSVAAVAAISLASCGGPSLCDCVNMKDDADDKMKESCKEMKKEWEEKAKNASEEEQKKMVEEVMACDKDKK